MTKGSNHTILRLHTGKELRGGCARVCGVFTFRVCKGGVNFIRVCKGVCLLLGCVKGVCQFSKGVQGCVFTFGGCVLTLG